MEESQIRKFFSNQTIFITGGSGFVGKVLIEKLLRECSDLTKIYVLLRPKKGKTTEERFSDFFSFRCFDILKSTNSEALQKVDLISGDCQQPFLGLSNQDLEILTKKTTCVFHAAANVKFDQSLKEAAYNARATKDLLECAKKMPNLKAFVYVSTAYSNSIHYHIKEELYEPPMKLETLLSVVDGFDENVLDAITPSILGKWPNTYIFTKCIAEDLFKSIGQDLPVTIVRPAIVCPSLAEPVPGWVDNFYGVMGISLGISLGVIRTLNIDTNSMVLVVPVDYVSNLILAATWKTEKANTKVYNFIGHKKSILSWVKMTKEYMLVHYWDTVSEKILWCNSCMFVTNKTLHKISVFFLHTAVAHLVDFILICSGRSPLAVKSYKRLDKQLELIAYFTTRNWAFDDGRLEELWNEMNAEDKKIFSFNMENMDWMDWTRKGAFGVRRYLLKETNDTIPRAQRKFYALSVAHYTLLALFWYLVYRFLSFICGLLF